jgi:ribosomal protein S18 acetylase RimI-like enzyme
MHIRPARSEELHDVGELTVAAYAEWLEGERDPYADHLRNAEARHREAELFVAVEQDDRTLLGTVTICPEGSPWREIGLADEGEFRMLAVAPEARGRGVGGALTQYCLDRFREVGAQALVLSTLPEMTAAHGIYTRLGFVRTPDRDWYPYPETVLITFRKDLAE